MSNDIYQQRQFFGIKNNKNIVTDDSNDELRKLEIQELGKSYRRIKSRNKNHGKTNP